MLMGNTRGTLERNILEPMRKLYPGLVGNIHADNTVEIFGKKAYALGADNKKHVARIQGATFEYVYGDEITTWSEEVFQMLKSRLRCPHSHFDGTCNPDSPDHWFKHFLDSDADIYQQAYVIDDGVLEESVVEELKKEYAGTMYYDRYILGLWARAEGLVYPMFSKARHVVKDGERGGGEYYISMDYGTVNPCAMLLWEYRDGLSTAIKEYYFDSRELHRQRTDEEHYAALEQLAEGYDVEYVIIDPSAASFKETIRRHGKFRVRDADNSVLDGIRLTATLLNADKLRFDERCEGAIYEFANYAWDETSPEDRPLKETDHCLTGDTIVDTVDGPARIVDLIGRSGRVYCTDGDTVKTGAFHDVRMTQEEAEVFEVELSNGKKVKATADHPFLTRHGWVRLEETRDDEVACIYASVEYVGIKSIKPAGREPVYNMEVDGYHNFSVNGGIIVHNCMDAIRYYCQTFLRREVRGGSVLA